MAPGTPSNQFLNGRPPQPNVQNQWRAIGQFQQRSGHPLYPTKIHTKRAVGIEFAARPRVTHQIRLSALNSIGRIMGETFGIIHVLIPDEAAEHGLAEKAGQQVAGGDADLAGHAQSWLSLADSAWMDLVSGQCRINTPCPRNLETA